jgi:hypothetical protein
MVSNRIMTFGHSVGVCPARKFKPLNCLLPFWFRIPHSCTANAGFTTSQLPSNLHSSKINWLARCIFSPTGTSAPNSIGKNTRHWSRFFRDRYGTPSGDYWAWNYPLYKDRPERYGDAVLLSHLSRSSIWETARTVITLEMSGKPKEGIYTVISYAKKK